MTVHIKDGGVWRQASEIHIKTGSTWREVLEKWIRHLGTWRKVHTAITSQEYVLFGGNLTNTTGTLSNLSGYANIKVAGVGAGGDGSVAFPGACCPGTAGGGGAAANIRGNSFPIPGNSISSIYYQVGGTGTSSDTFVQINGPGGTDLIRFRAGGAGSTGGAGAGGAATGGGPNCIAGSPGGGIAARFSNGQAGTPSTGACGGGGGAGGAIDNGQPGTFGGTGGSSNFGPIAPAVIATIGTGPAPTTWSIGPSSVSGGTGGYGSTAGTCNGYPGTAVEWAYGGDSAGCMPPGSGGYGAGGAGAGIRWTDPSDPTNNGKAFGGGGGGVGSSLNPVPHPTFQRGGKGFLIIQLTS